MTVDAVGLSGEAMIVRLPTGGLLVQTTTTSQCRSPKASEPMGKYYDPQYVMSSFLRQTTSFTRKGRTGRSVAQPSPAHLTRVQSLDTRVSNLPAIP